MKAAFPPEFLLCMACCRWPPSPARDELVRSAAAGVTDWAYFLEIGRRQRVLGLVNQSLVSAQVRPPEDIANTLAFEADLIMHQNLTQAVEVVRLQGLLQAAGIACVFVKGVTLAALAYGSLLLKQGRDIDLLVAPKDALTALALLEDDGYRLWQPLAHLNEKQRSLTVEFAKEVELIHARTGFHLELHWRLTDAPSLLSGIDAVSSTLPVRLGGEAAVRTLQREQLFAYVCAHGAVHFWSRLKWVADLNALVSGLSPDEIIGFYDQARKRGAGICAGQGLLVCKNLLACDLPASLASEIYRDRRVRWLADRALAFMGAPDFRFEETHGTHGLPGKGDRLVAQLFLSRSPRFLLEHCRNSIFRISLLLAYPLPRAFFFIYPLLRIADWIYRRARCSARARA